MADGMLSKKHSKWPFNGIRSLTIDDVVLQIVVDLNRVGSVDYHKIEEQDDLQKRAVKINFLHTLCH